MILTKILLPSMQLFQVFQGIHDFQDADSFIPLLYGYSRSSNPACPTLWHTLPIPPIWLFSLCFCLAAPHPIAVTLLFSLCHLGVQSDPNPPIWSFFPYLQVLPVLHYCCPSSTLPYGYFSNASRFCASKWSTLAYPPQPYGYCCHVSRDFQCFCVLLNYSQTSETHTYGYCSHISRYSLPSPSIWLLIPCFPGFQVCCAIPLWLRLCNPFIWLLFPCFPGFPVFLAIPLWLNLPKRFHSSLSEASLQIHGFQIFPMILHVFQYNLY